MVKKTEAKKLNKTFEVELHPITIIVEDVENEEEAKEEALRRFDEGELQAEVKEIREK